MTHRWDRSSSCDPKMEEPVKRYAVVTGANKGIGFGICKQLASNGIIVILTARNDKRGQEAVKKLEEEECGLSGQVVYHQLDVTDPASIASLADFIKTRFGKLDFLINNAGVGGVVANEEALKAALGKEGAQINWREIFSQPCNAGEECLSINYYGAKRMVEALINLLQLSDSPRIVSVSSSMGKLENVSNEWAKGVFGNTENLTEEKVDEVVKVFLDDFKDGSFTSKGWPVFMAAYIISKAALNAYTRVMAKKFPNFYINCVCPGFVKTDVNFNTGILSVEEGAESPVKLALLPDGGPSGRFFIRKEESAF